MSDNISMIVRQFQTHSPYSHYDVNNSGNINKTYVVYTLDSEKYILQKINTTVFNEPFLLMHNIEGVTEHIREKVMSKPNNKHLKIIYTQYGKSLYRDSEDNYWRMYNYISGCITYDNIFNKSIFYEVGRGFGNFQMLLDDYPASDLNEVIRDFHNTAKRYETFINDVRKDACDRVKLVTPEIVQIIQAAKSFNKITDMLETGEIPIRVTHNDTKINNVMMDEKTGHAVCVIDLDTVMPGSALYDFADAIRSGANTAGEEEEDISKVELNLSLFRAFTEGYLKEASSILKESEIINLSYSCYIITIELAMRFLNDFINGDTYFKCEKENHNLLRARNQLALARDIRRKIPEMKIIVKDIYANL